MRGVSLSLFTVFVAFSITSCEKQQTTQQAPPPPAVVAVEVVKSPVTPVDEYIAQTKAQDNVDLFARVQGFLTKRNFIEGQMVKKGDLLLQIEKDQYDANVEACQGALDAQKAKYQDALIEYNRQKTLVASGAVAQRDYDNALYHKLVIEADITQADANLKLAKINLGYTDIWAPFEGRVGLCTYSVGNVVGPNSGKLATIVRVNPMRVEFNIDEMDVLRFNIKVAGENVDEIFPNRDQYVVRLKFQNDQFYRHEGQMSYANNHINISTGTLLVQAEFQNPDNILIPGMYVKIVISRKNPVQALLVPAKAIMENQTGSFVYVVGKDDKIESRQIKTGDSFGKMKAVESGLSQGEKVVTDGLQKIRPGIVVSVTLDKSDVATAVTETVR